MFGGARVLPTTHSLCPVRPSVSCLQLWLDELVNNPDTWWGNVPVTCLRHDSCVTHHLFLSVQYYTITFCNGPWWCPVLHNHFSLYVPWWCPLLHNHFLYVPWWYYVLYSHIIRTVIVSCTAQSLLIRTVISVLYCTITSYYTYRDGVLYCTIISYCTYRDGVLCCTITSYTYRDGIMYCIVTLYVPW